MNRGSSRRLHWSGRRDSRFNEAPIHESGKLKQIQERRNIRLRRFNEAPIHESGK